MQCRCGNFYTPINYETDTGICPECFYSSQGYSYTSREWDCGDVSGDFSLKNNDENE